MQIRQSAVGRSGAEDRSREAGRKRWPALACALVLLAGAAGRAADRAGDWASDSVALPAPGRGAWQTFSFPGRERVTEYAAVMEEGQAAIRSLSECSASALVLRSEDIDLERTPILSWQWKVHRPLSLENERVRAGDDFAARVYVAFRFDEQRASLWQRVRRGLAQTIYGDELPGAALTYVWASSEPAGQRWDNPFTSATKMISLGRGDLADWRRESVDVLGDFRDLVGGEPPPLLFLALMTDSDDSCSSAGAYFADFRFRARRGPEDPG